MSQRRAHHVESTDESEAWSPEFVATVTVEEEAQRKSEGQLHSINSKAQFGDRPKRRVCATMMIAGAPVLFQIDSGATCNVVRQQ